MASAAATLRRSSRRAFSPSAAHEPKIITEPISFSMSFPPFSPFDSFVSRPSARSSAPARTRRATAAAGRAVSRRRSRARPHARRRAPPCRSGRRARPPRCPRAKMISSIATSAGDMVLQQHERRLLFFVHPSRMSVQRPDTELRHALGKACDLAALVRNGCSVPGVRNEPHPLAHERRLAAAGRCEHEQRKRRPPPIYGAIISSSASICRATRRLSEEIRRTPVTLPFSATAVPQTEPVAAPRAAESPCRMLSA